MAHKKHQFTAQERVKRSQNAKKRLRGVNGRFLDGLRASGALQLAQEGYGTRHGTSPSYVKETYVQAESDVKRLPRGKLESELAYRRTKAITGSESVRQFDTTHAPVRATSTATTAALKSYREKNWRKAEAFKSETRLPPEEFLSNVAGEDLQGEVNRLATTPNTPFTKGLEGAAVGKGRRPHAVRRRVQKYTDARQRGMSHEDALAEAQKDARGRPKTTGPQARRTGRSTTASADRSRRTKYTSATPRGAEIPFGIDVESIDKVSAIKSRFDERIGDREAIQMQQAQRESVYSDFLRNQKWAHETKRANILGDKGKDAEDNSDDKVVFFTTSLGGPSPSVPSDSLIGQYIIRKRKQMMKDAGVPRSQLRGEFPAAVRDQHIFEWSTGLSYGLRGEQGAFKETGWRRGTKTSAGYGKPRPLGSQIVTGSDGRPVYDSNGNIRYSDGATRLVDYRTPNAGLRIFIG